LQVYYTRIGDMPERILRDSITLADNSREWSIRGREEEILRPEASWEGAELPIAPSRRGAARHPENALRDPAIYAENGETYLLYAIAGEQGIAVTRIAAVAQS
jgi:hypothetical protein